MNVYEKLLNVQATLKAPKGQFNSFGKYKYRSCEDILEAVKPILNKVNACLVISDELVQMGEKYFIKANASFIDVETSEFINNSALAEIDEHKGMSKDQCTGTSSSYARKYCLNGLFLIDDTKDSDTDEAHNEREAKANNVALISAEQVEKVLELCKGHDEWLPALEKQLKKSIGSWTSDEAEKKIASLTKRVEEERKGATVNE